MANACEDTFDDDFEDDDESALDWCVDFNPALCAMTTEELWSAAAEGRVTRETRAWRLGLEAWTTLSEIPEIASAFEVPHAEATLRVVAQLVDAEPASGPMSETAVTPPAVEITQIPTSVEPANPAARTRSASPAPARASWAHSIAGRIRGAVADARWVFAGSAIAAASIGLALMTSLQPAALGVAQATASAAVARAVLVAAASAAPKEPRATAIQRVAAPPRAELGQRRLRSSRIQGHSRR